MIRCYYRICKSRTTNLLLILLFLFVLFQRQRQAAAGEAVGLSDEDLAEVIMEIRKLWPECRMVRGSPRHSQSNGGVERVNRTVQYKLGQWLQDTNSVRWTIGCKIVMWRYNTQHHRTIGTTPYHLLVGQAPRVGISQLPLDPALLETLATEAELNQLIEIQGIDHLDGNDGGIDGDEGGMDGEDEEMGQVDVVGVEQGVAMNDAVDAAMMLEYSSQALLSMG